MVSLHGNRNAKTPGKELHVRVRATCCSQPTLGSDRRDSSLSVVGLPGHHEVRKETLSWGESLALGRETSSSATFTSATQSTV